MPGLPRRGRALAPPGLHRQKLHPPSQIALANGVYQPTEAEITQAQQCCRRAGGRRQRRGRLHGGRQDGGRPSCCAPSHRGQLARRRTDCRLISDRPSSRSGDTPMTPSRRQFRRCRPRRRRARRAPRARPTPPTCPTPPGPSPWSCPTRPAAPTTCSRARWPRSWATCSSSPSWWTTAPAPAATPAPAMSPRRAGRLHPGRRVVGMTTNAAVQTGLPFDPVKSFAPVAMFAKGPFVVAVNKDFRPKRPPSWCTEIKAHRPSTTTPARAPAA